MLLCDSAQILFQKDEDLVGSICPIESRLDSHHPSCLVAVQFIVVFIAVVFIVVYIFNL